MPSCPTLPVKRALSRIRNGDVGLLRPTGAEGRWIYRLGRTEFSHACMFVWLARKDAPQRMGPWTLWIVEQIQPAGRLVQAVPYFESCPAGTVHVFRPRASAEAADRAAQWMLDNVPGTPYPQWLLLRSLLSHLAIARWRVRPDSDDEANGALKSLYCSAAVAKGWRVGGGVDLVPRRADSWTEPGDLAISAAMDLLFKVG